MRTLFAFRAAALSTGGRPEQLDALAVTPSFISTLRRVPALGLGFTEEDAKPGAGPSGHLRARLVEVAPVRHPTVHNPHGGDPAWSVVVPCRRGGPPPSGRRPNL